MNKYDVKEEQRIKNYRIEKTLGKGTFGKVKLAVHTPTNEKVIHVSINRLRLKYWKRKE